ncbi:unnamed protein product, partial [Prorocentrum cordatum]
TPRFRPMSTRRVKQTLTKGGPAHPRMRAQLDEGGATLPGGAAASAAGPPAGSEIPHVLLRMTGRPDRSQWQVTQPAAPPPPPARATLGPRRPR